MKMSVKFCQQVVHQVKANLNKVIKLRGQITLKEDGSYVSEGDLLVQEIVFELVKKELPNHKLISEEFAPFPNINWDESSSYVVLDPIDGTENFISGLREWGVGISVYTDGKHEASCIYLPELDETLMTGMPLKRHKSRIIGLSSSLTVKDLEGIPSGDFEFRIIGCSMYNTLSAVKGSFAQFENVKGVNCWDVLPGLNLALEHGCKAEVDGKPYQGQILFPIKKYKIKLSNLQGAQDA